jgi:predicted transcriptional regulator
MKKVQFTIDGETSRRIESLARPRAGNKSFVVREAVRRMAEQEGFEEYLDWLEHQPGVRTSLERGLSDIQAGRTVTHKQALARARRPVRR